MKYLLRGPLVGSLILVIVLLVVHLGALSYGFYYIFPWLDTVMHIIGGIALSLMIFTLHRAYAPHAPWRHYAYMICIGILVIGGVWEFMEYIIDMVAGTNLFSMTLIDTATDMIGNIIGGGIGFCMVYYRYGKK